ncbi:MAG: transposase [Bacteroides sp.]|nr:transposase [Bacteroides sp.]MCM1095602.1 transposase [Terasakiella sp.]
MSNPFIVFPADTLYFVTSTVVDWIDVFTRPVYRDIIIDSLDHCIKHKGLQIYGWVLMSNHIHMLAAHDINNKHLAMTLADFKKYTSKQIIKEIAENPVESRREWMLRHFRRDDNEGYTLWQKGYHPFAINNIKMFRQKLDYIHDNPVRAGFVDNPGDYPYSSYRDYSGQKGRVAITFIDF